MCTELERPRNRSLWVTSNVTGPLPSPKSAVLLSGVRSTTRSRSDGVSIRSAHWTARRRSNLFHCMFESEILLSRTGFPSRYRRWHAYPNRSTRSRLHLVDLALCQANARDDPISATALHALPCILADVGLAFGAFEPAIQFALLELGTHPG
jgi:hypothetical protein